MSRGEWGKTFINPLLGTKRWRKYGSDDWRRKGDYKRKLQRKMSASESRTSDAGTGSIKSQYTGGKHLHV
jgi:hypothetical protein